MNFPFEKYNNFLFDCDGVILDSNQVKGKVFVDIASCISPAHTEEFKKFHELNGGLNRRAKFQHFFQHILGKSEFEKDVQDAVDAFRDESLRALKSAQLVPGIREFLGAIPSSKKKYVVSASDHADLPIVLKEKNLDSYFDGLYGGPRKKPEVIRELKLKGTSVFFGDSIIDYQTALEFGFDFVFIFGVCSWPDWKMALSGKPVTVAKDFTSLLA